MTDAGHARRLRSRRGAGRGVGGRGRAGGARCPGASSVLAAVASAGIAGPRWSFEGFLPRSGRDRRERLAAIAADGRGSVVFEAPGRVAATLRDLAAACGAARAGAVCRELTKLHETITRGSLGELAVAGRRRGTIPARGEVVIVVGWSAGRGTPRGRRGPTRRARRAGAAAPRSSGWSRGAGVARGARRPATGVPAACTREPRPAPALRHGPVACRLEGRVPGDGAGGGAAPPPAGGGDEGQAAAASSRSSSSSSSSSSPAETEKPASSAIGADASGSIPFATACASSACAAVSAR